MIERQSWRQQTITLSGGTTKAISFNDQIPNFAQIRNFTNNEIYVSSSANVSPSNFEIKITGNGGSRNYINPTGMTNLYVYSALDGVLQINSANGDINPTDIDQTINITGSISLSSTEVKPATTPSPVLNVVMTLANTEYYLDLPAGTKVITASIIDFDSTANVKYYYVSGGIGFILKGNMSYYNNMLNLPAITRIYFKCDIAGKTMQVETMQ